MPAAPPPLSKAGPGALGGSTTADSKVVVETLGQGLSKKLEKDAADAIAAAQQTCKMASNGLYEDSAFPATDASLGASASSLGVATWRRISEIEPPSTLPRSFDGTLLSTAEGVGLRMGALKDEWLLGALNVVAGNVDVTGRIFVDSSHSAEGFYVVRLWAEDPSSDDDWAVVIVDDRIPCDSEGAPAFGKGSKPGAMWAAIVEKAVAKRYGTYSQLIGDGGGEATLRGLELVTGGKARQLPMPAADDESAMGEAWSALKEALSSDQVVCARCDLGSPAANAAPASGIVPGRTYSLIVANDIAGNGQKLVRLRGFAGDPEWNGKWSDASSEWNSRLRQLLAYSKDAEDGTFWMGFDDFVLHFTSLYATRVADDRWHKFTVKSRWAGNSAGGGPACASWRDNPQWLLSVPRETTMTLEVSLPDARLSSEHLLAVPPLGLLVCHGNGGLHARKRKLRIRESSEIVLQPAPSASRRLQIVARLPPSPDGAPYVLVPFLASAGAESPFRLTILLDDVDDDGKPDIALEAIAPKDDWQTKRFSGPWMRASASPGNPAFSQNDKLTFGLQPAPNVAGSVGGAHVYVCVETRGLSLDMRTKEGLQASVEEAYPPIGFALLPAAAGAELSPTLPHNAQVVQPLRRDGCWLEAQLPPSGAANVLVPFLGPAGISGYEGAQYVATVYTDASFGEVAGGTGDEWDEIEDNDFFKIVWKKMDKLEKLMDARIKLLDNLLIS